MASDYKKITKEHEKRYGWDTKPRRIYKQLYSNKTHFVYELIQNADDSKSQHLELQLDSDALFVWNDGRQFKEKDVRSICSLGSSDKDLTHIGTFGIGFKAVYNYTESPEIYSGDERFRILDFIKPKGIDEMPPEIAKLVNEGKTVFRLPFKDSPHHVEDIKHLKDRLCNLAKERSLLFLRHLEKVEWKDIRNAEIGSYSCHRHLYDKIQDVPDNESVELVKLTVSLNSSNKRSETFLAFCKAVKPQQNVIDALLDRAEDEEEQQRILQSSEELQPIEVAFKLQDGRITPIDDNCMLVAFLPTQKETHLKFLIQGRYQTTPARDNIPKPQENPWNRWLVHETANFLPEILEQLKASGLLEPTFFNVLPLKRDVENEFKPIAEALQKAMQERAFVPTQSGGYAKAENVFYPNTTSLRKLVKSSGMCPDSSLLHPDIRKGTKESGRCFEIMHEAGVKEIDASDLLCWLEKQSCDWFQNRTNEWLRSLYIYFYRKWSESGWERIKKLPLVRLENGEHVCVSDQLVFFPPDTDEDLEEIKPFLNDLPILQSVLLEDEDHDDVKAFLEENLGVEDLHPKNLINELICPLYNQPNKPSIMKNRRHVRYIFKSWQKATESERSELKKSISKVPLLRAYKGIQRETSDFVVPFNAYLPQAYTGDNDLETYFSISNGDLWFVDDKYLRNKSDTKAWLQFLKAIGAMNTPQITDMEVSGSGEECKNRNIAYENSTRPFRDGKFKYVWSRHRYFDGYIVDRSLDGLPEVLAQISNHNEIYLPKALWGLLVKLVSSLPSEESQQSAFFRRFFQGTYHWFYQTDRRKSFDAAFYRQLKETPWLPDEQGNLHSPDKCFVPTSKNQEILGDSVTYVHSDFDMNTRPAQWLAKKLDVRLEGDANNVLNYLQTLSQKEASIEKVERIYKFLSLENEHLWRFEEESLIFTPEPEPRWWLTDEVFWEDESAVFGDDRGYLKAHYSENLKSFFTTSLEVPERADTLDYVRGIQDITSKMQAGTKEIRNRVQKLYRHLWLSLQENGDSLEREEWQEECAQIREGKCWLGKKGNEWNFFFRHELVWNDHKYLADIFEGEVPFWGFNNDLLEFAKDLGVKGCYQSSDVEFDHYGDRGESPIWSEKAQNLRLYIHDFLHSPRLCEGHGEEKSTEVLNQLSVCRAQELKVRYKLNKISVTDPNPRQSFLTVMDQRAVLWLGLKEDEKAYPDLIGDALQDYFGIDQLREFVKDLLLTTDSHIDKTLLSWERRGLQVNLCLSPPETDSKEDGEKSPELFDEKVPSKTGSQHDVPETIEPKVETPIVHEGPETGSGSTNSVTEGSETHTDTPPSTSGTSQSGGHWRSTSSGGNGGGGHGSHSGGGESNEHRELKEDLAFNPSQLGKGLELVKIEYTFDSNDRVDILLRDGFGNPVTVEVETGFSFGNGRHVGVWQAVKYKHLAAVKYGLPCDQVRSILAAPEIPDDVKAKCKELGIEPIEVSHI